MAQRTALRELKLKEKMDLLNFLESSSQRKILEKFGVSKTTVGILKRKEEYLERISFLQSYDWRKIEAYDDWQNRTTPCI